MLTLCILLGFPSDMIDLDQPVQSPFKLRNSRCYYTRYLSVWVIMLSIWYFCIRYRCIWYCCVVLFRTHIQRVNILPFFSMKHTSNITSNYNFCKNCQIMKVILSTCRFPCVLLFLGGGVECWAPVKMEPIILAVQTALKCTHPSKQLIPGHHQPTSETPFKWRFIDGQIVARSCMLIGT